MKSINFLSSISAFIRTISHRLFGFLRTIWQNLTGFVIANKIYVGWGLVIIVPLAGLIILFIYLANRPKETPQPYIQTNHPKIQQPEPYSFATLYVTQANGNRVNIPMIYDRMIIGNKPGCQIVLQDGNVADQHAEIYTTEGRYFVRDLGSGYGTYVNSALISDITELFAGYYVQMGGSTIQL
jgi:hypothetical protein